MMTAIDNIKFCCLLTEYIATIKLEKPINRQMKAATILFIFGRKVPKNKIKKTTCRLIAS